MASLLSREWFRVGFSSVELRCFLPVLSRYFYLLVSKRYGYISAAWNRILTAVEKTRNKESGMLRLFPANLTGEGLFGLAEAAVSKMTESVGMTEFFFILY